MSALNAPLGIRQHVTAIRASDGCHVCHSADLIHLHAIDGGTGTVEIGLFECINPHDGVKPYGRRYSDVTPVDEAADDELKCPECPHTVASHDNSDTARTEMVGHFLADHHHQSVNDLLAKTKLIPGGAA